MVGWLIQCRRRVIRGRVIRVRAWRLTARGDCLPLCLRLVIARRRLETHSGGRTFCGLVVSWLIQCDTGCVIRLSYPSLYISLSLGRFSVYCADAISLSSLFLSFSLTLSFPCLSQFSLSSLSSLPLSPSPSLSYVRAGLLRKG